MPKPKSKPATDSRSAIDGRFVSKAKAKSDPATTVTTRRKAKAKACGICGGSQVWIRGYLAIDKRRLVCPTCLADRLEQIRLMSTPETFVAWEAT